jgi:uncharacterized protein YecT (DUF1311 family)
VSLGYVALWLSLGLTLVAPRASAQSPATGASVLSEYRAADVELNRVYRQILAERRADTAFVRKFRLSQRAWLVYRDAEIAALYPASDSGAYGSVYAVCRAHALTGLTRERVAILRRWTSPVPEGDVCAGSLRRAG